MNTTIDQLTDLIARRPAANDSRSLRLRWLLDMAAALDGTAIDGAADLATTARDLALALMTDTVTVIGQGVTVRTAP